VQICKVNINLCANNHAQSVVPTFTSLLNSYTVPIPQWIPNRLESLGYIYPTDVQIQAYNILLNTENSEINESQDAVIHAQTGSGKTLAYLIPLLCNVDLSRSSIQALVVVPTQELGMQVYSLTKRITSGFETEVSSSSGSRYYVLPLLEEGDLRRQKLQIRKVAPRIIIATPNRLIEVAQSGRFDLYSLKFLVVDEFDASLADSSTSKALQNILSSSLSSLAATEDSDSNESQMEAAQQKRKQRQTVLVSATVPQHRHFLKQCIEEHWTRDNVKHLYMSADQPMPEQLEHVYVVCDRKKKLSALCSVLCRSNAASTIVFVHESRSVEDISKVVEDGVNRMKEKKKLEGGNEENWRALKIVGLSEEISGSERKRNLEMFRDGSVQVLVTNELATRGLDIPELSRVIHLDLPKDSESYLHRSGRAGRLNRAGIVISICDPKELFVIDRFSNSLKVQFNQASMKSLSQKSYTKAETH